MKKYAAATLLSAGLVLGPISAATAQEGTQTEQDEDDDSGLLGLIGLAGLLGLAGLARRDRRDRRYGADVRGEGYGTRTGSTTGTAAR